MPTNALLPRVKQGAEATDARGADAIHDKAVTFPTQIEIAARSSVSSTHINVRDWPFIGTKRTLRRALSIAG
jgi:hypothetical protein